MVLVGMPQIISALSMNNITIPFSAIYDSAFCFLSAACPLPNLPWDTQKACPCHRLATPILEVPSSQVCR